jgi:hypothetical protein
LEIRFFIYGALGWCSEIAWTAVRKRVTGVAHDWLLVGETSLWSFPLYGSIAFLYESLHDALRAQFFLVRALVYLIDFWVIEYAGGWFGREDHRQAAVGLFQIAGRQLEWIDSLEFCFGVARGGVGVRANS